MIDQIDEVLTGLLRDSLVREGVKDIEVTFGTPSPSEVKKPTINLYLHSIQENAALRETGRELARVAGDREATIGRGPVTVELRYLVTAVGADATAGHKLLSSALVALLRTSIFDIDSNPDLIREPVERLQLVVAQPSAEQGTSLWRAIGQPLQPSLSLVANVTFRPFETRVVRLVREFVMGLGQGMDQNGAKRNITLKSLRVGAAGIVADESTGVPISGAKVEVVSTGQATTTDERGFFLFEGLNPGQASLRATHPTYVEETQATQVPPIGRSDLLEPVGFSLKRMGDADAAANLPRLWQEPKRIVKVEVTGRLRLDDGRPAAYTSVRIDGKEAMTDKEGFYVIGGLMPGSHKLEALLPQKGWVEIASSGEVDKKSRAKEPQKTP